jgi:hypothetical protein
MAKFLDRIKARRLGRKAFNKANGNLEQAELLFKEDARAEGLDPATILMLLQLAYKFWRWLKDNGYLENAPESTEQIDFT